MLTLNEATKRMTEDVAHLREKGNDHLADAIDIGIEALKQIQRIRVIEGKPDICWLPGETEEAK